jgi:hypothetical protein
MVLLSDFLAIVLLSRFGGWNMKDPDEAKFLAG